MTRQDALDFQQGFWFWARGWRFIFKNPSLIKFAILPALLCLHLAVSVIFILLKYLPRDVKRLTAWIHPDGWIHDFLYYPLLVSAGLLIFVSTIYFSYLLISLISIPFNTALAERTLGILGKKPDAFKSWNDWFRHTLHMLRVGVMKLLLLLSIGFFLFIFSFLPGLNVFTLGAAMLLLALDCMDYSLDPFGLGLRRRLRYYIRNWAQWFGMAAGLALTLLVPGLTLLIIPGAVVGAAMIVKSENL